jgi:ABC-2 type transport system permease protein
LKTKFSIFSGYKALLKASIIAMLKSPSSVIFSIGFPLVFIVAFSYLDASQHKTYNIGIQGTNPNTIENFKFAIQNNKFLNYQDITSDDSAQIMYKFKHQLLDLILIPQNETFNQYHIATTSLEIDEVSIVDAMLEHELNSEKQNQYEHLTLVRAFKKIDYILPGQLGFSLLASSVFGTAFLFYNLRKNLVLKRFLATPIHPFSIIFAECSARIIIQVLSTILLILIGYYFLDLTLINGIATFFQILTVCIIAAFSFLSYGFIISSIAKSESIIPPLANIVTLPQFVLADTFIPIDKFPEWIQFISNLLPLTYFNHALRSISFDGMSIYDVKTDILILIGWGVVSIFIATKVFKWR